MNRYATLKVEELINKMLYQENVIDKRKYENVAKKIEELLFEESKKIDHI